MRKVLIWKVCPQPVSTCELAPWLEWSLPWRPEVEAGCERMIMDWIYGCFPLVTEHFFCCCDEANFSLLEASIYSASHCSAGKLLFSLATDAAVWVLHTAVSKAPILGDTKDAVPRCSLEPNRDNKWNKYKWQFMFLNVNSEIALYLLHCLCLSPCTVKVWALSRPPRLFKHK